MYLTLFQEISQKPRRKRKHLLSIHTNFVRGLPFGCPFCKKEIWLDKDNKPMVLGCHEIRLPNMEKKYMYSFPTMLYHYITEHDYCPPDEFLKALLGFDINQRFDCHENHKKIFKD